MDEKRHSKDHDHKRRSSEKKRTPRNSGEENGHEEGEKRERKHSKDHTHKDELPPPGSHPQGHYTHVVTHHPAEPQPHVLAATPSPNDEDHDYHQHKRHSHDKDENQSPDDHKNSPKEGEKRNSHDHNKHHDHDKRHSRNEDHKNSPKEGEKRHSHDQNKHHDHDKRHSHTEDHKNSPKEGEKRHSHDHNKHDHDKRHSHTEDQKKIQLNEFVNIGDQENHPAPELPENIWKKIPSRVINLQKPVDSKKPAEPEPTETAEIEPVPLEMIEDESPEIVIPDTVVLPDELPSDIGIPFAFLDDDTENKLRETNEDIQIGEKLSEIMDHYRGELKHQARLGKKHKYPKYTYTEIVALLTKQGIPVPADDDFARLEATHGTQWDPDGTIVEYYSPVLRSFIPINMRGRYRGCWAEDKCIQGLDVSKLGPKPDALEGYIDRSRQVRIQDKYNIMGEVANDEGHLDYLIEMQKYQSEILPIPIFYDVLNLGMETLNENLLILATEEGFPPAHRIYETTELQARHVRRKLQIYAGLGLEPLDSGRKGLGRMNPEWEKTRDEIINSLLSRRHQEEFILQNKQDQELAARLQAEEPETAETAQDVWEDEDEEDQKGVPKSQKIKRGHENVSSLKSKYQLKYGKGK